MASKETLVSKRGNQRASATKYISNAKLEMNKEEEGGEGADLEILDTFLDKLSEKLAKIKVFGCSNFRTID